MTNSTPEAKAVDFIDVPLTPTTPIATNVTIIETVSLNQQMIKTLKYSKIINIICLIDVIFGILYSVYYPNFFYTTLLSLIGYFGSKGFSKKITLLYLFFIVLNFIFRIINFSWLLSESYEVHTNTSFILLSIILYCFEIFIISLVFRFIYLLKKLSDSEIKFLKNDQNVQKQFICNCI